jgi:dihydrofolate reductase
VTPLPLVLVVAVAENGVIGRAGQLPWRIPGDLKHFKAVTLGKPVLMGRRTWESIGKPLPGRANIVLTRDPRWRAEGTFGAPSLDAAFAIANREALALGAGEIAVIGGSALFAETLPRAARIELTEVHASPAGDTFFPSFDRSEFSETRREGPQRGPKDEYAWSAVTLEKNN